MKRRDLVRRLEAAGFALARHGTRHDIFRRGDLCLAVPRHRELKEPLAQRLLRQAGA